MGALQELRDQGLIAVDWAEALTPVEDRIAGLAAFLRAETAAGRGHQPSWPTAFRAFVTPLAQVRVLIVGQDPYPNPAYPIGLSFAVERSVRPLPASLRSIHRELHADLGLAPPDHGDLSAWTAQGVLLLNRVLTVQPGVSNSHRRQGWEEVTECAIDALARRAATGVPMAAILWGAAARSLEHRLAPIPAVTSAHPSPLSASRGFFGSRPFSRVNELLVAGGGAPVDWALDDRQPREYS